jgi:hypothetical protein
VYEKKSTFGPSPWYSKFSSFIYAQNDRFAFAITDLQSTGCGWNALRKLDLKSGGSSSIKG